MRALDPIPDRHPRLVIWAAAFRRANWPLRRIADLFEIDPATLAEGGGRTVTPAINQTYAAQGWPSIDPRSPNYCYQPCANGLHVCGFHPDGQNFLTVANVTTADAVSALALFNRAKAELAVPEGEDGDFVVDLQLDGDCSEDFSMHRQMLDRLVAMGRTVD